MTNFTNPLYNPYRIYYPPQQIYSYGYPPIYFEHVDTLKNNNMNSQKVETNNWNKRQENSTNSEFKFNDIISLDNDRISVLGFSINIDDLIILVTIFTMIKDSNEIDYMSLIILGLLLFSQE